MDLATRIEKRYLEYGPWSQTAYVHPKASKQSIHRSQLDFTRDKIQRLNILSGDGTTIEFEKSECKQLRLAFTGGTDDPSIELSLKQFSSHPLTGQYFTPTIIYKFTAFANSETDYVSKDRNAVDFLPEQHAEKEPVGDDFLGPTNFTDSLYGLCLERFMKDDTPCVRLSWRSRRMITYGLSLVTRTSADHLEIARRFCDISEKQKALPSKPQTFTVEVPDYYQRIQYQYRYLLACPTGLQAYWRYRLLPDMQHGAVPANLCELLPLSSREVQEMESPDSDIKTTWDNSKWFPDSNCALAPVYTFSSIAQVEFYVKGGILYEEHAISLLRKRNLHLHWDVEFEELRQKQTDGSVSIWVAILTLVDPSPNSTRAVRPDILPKEGSSVPLRWMPQENQRGKVGSWKGVLLKAEVGFSQRVRLAVLVWPQTSSSLSATELTRTHRPAFDFSLEPENLGFMLNSMDKLLFLDKPCQPSNPTAKRILEVLMARDNSKEIEEIFSTMYFDERMPRVSSHMDGAQYKAMLTLSTRLITVVDGPVLSGKTMIGSVFGALSICLGEKVTFLAKTKNALKNLFLKVVEVSKSLYLSSAVTDQFSLTENLCPLPSGDQELDDMLSRVEWTKKYEFSMPIRTASRFTPSKSGNGVPTAQFTTYDELDSLNGEFGTTLLICIEAEQAHDHSIFAACGLSAGTLKKVALFGNSDKVPIGVTSRDLNHLRSQVELTTFWRLACTGVETTKLDKQYGMHPEISALPTRHLYWTKSPMKRDVDDGFEPILPNRGLMQKWVAEYLNKETKKAKLSVFSNVKDGICLQDPHGVAKANHHNMVAILDILRSMIGCKLPRKSIIILTFFPEAVIAIREFLTSQGCLGCPG